MSRQVRTIAIVFAFALLMIFFFRSYESHAIPSSRDWEHEKAPTDEAGRKQDDSSPAMPAALEAEAERLGDHGAEPAGLEEPPVKDSAPAQKDDDFESTLPEALEAEAARLGAPELASSEEPSAEDSAQEQKEDGIATALPAALQAEAERLGDDLVPQTATATDPILPTPPAHPAEDSKADKLVPFSNVDMDDNAEEPDSLVFTAVPSPPAASPTPAGIMNTISEDSPVDWSTFAYTQYVTDSDYLCNSVMIFESLHRLGSKPDRVMMYPRHMLADPGTKIEAANSDNQKLICKARDEYNVKLVPIQVEHREGQDDTWADSYTKLLAFNQTQYNRVLSLDSDSTILQPLDDLFLLPPVPVAMPRAYWLLNDEPPKKILSSQLILLQPSASEFARIKQHIDEAGDNEYDMEIVNELYLDSAMVLPHRPYNMLSAEFRRAGHSDYLGTDQEEWDPVKIYNEARFVHFSDWPVPKPWIRMNDGERVENEPKCDGGSDCTERKLWNGLYDDFWERKQEVCKTENKRKFSKEVLEEGRLY